MKISAISTKKEIPTNIELKIICFSRLVIAKEKNIYNIYKRIWKRDAIQIIVEQYLGK